MSLFEFIKKSPKAELHLHIEGTLEPDQMFVLAKKNNIQIPFKSIDDVKRAYNFDNLDSFLKIYYEGTKVLVKEQDFFDLTWAYALKCKEENIVHTEIFFDPQTHIERGVKFDVVINGIYNALLKAEKQFGLSFKIIMCFLRHLDESPCFKILNQAILHKEKIFGVGLDSSEMGNPPSKFKRLFKKALENNFITVAHAGEEGPPKYIWEALKLLNVKRIDHGVQCIKDK
ncbi:adenosine deaminase, partial [Candidatus Pelagibacter sp.]|nr:adenosine deaminase [Candidatus Pelagibacter sp.]